MRNIGNYISGELIAVDNHTRHWTQVNVHPDSFMIRFDEYQAALKHINGLYTDLDDGFSTCVRFAEEADAIIFRFVYDRCNE